MAKRLLSIFVAVFMVMAIIPMNAFAVKVNPNDVGDVYAPVDEVTAGKCVIGATIDGVTYVLKNNNYATGEGYTYFTRGIEAELQNGNVVGVADAALSITDVEWDVTVNEDGTLTFAAEGRTLRAAETYDDLYMTPYISNAPYMWTYENGLLSVPTNSHGTRYITYVESTTYNGTTTEHVFYAPADAEGATVMTIYQVVGGTEPDPTEPAEQVITEVDIQNFTAPEWNAYATVDVTLPDDAHCTIDANRSDWWLSDESGEDYWYMLPTEQFNSEYYYYWLALELVADEGYTFAEDVTVTFNGDASITDVAYISSTSGNLCVSTIDYTVEEPTVEPTEPTPTEPIAAGDLDEALNVEGGNLHFVSEGEYPWVVVEDYAQSSNAGVSSSSSIMTTTVTIGEDGGSVAFDYMAYGEGTGGEIGISTVWDKCQFKVDGEVVLKVGALQNDWTEFTYDLEAGEHELTWSYDKDSSVNPNGDFFAVDNVVVTGLEGGDTPGAEGVAWHFETEDDFNAWTLEDADGDGYNWAWSANNSYYTGVDGSNAIYSASYFSGSYKVALNADNWIYSPAAVVPADDPTLTFWARNYSSAYMDTLEVYIVVDGDPVSVMDAFEPASAYTEYTVDLTDYAGEEIQVAFRHTGNDKWGLMVDDVILGTPAEEPVEPTEPPVEPTEPPVEPGDGLTWDFSEGADDWTFVDADEDGYNFEYSPYVGDHTTGGYTGVIASASYDNDFGALTPDNWAFTPALTAEDLSEVTISFWANAQDNGYAAEHFGAFVGNSMDPDDMIEIGAWTMTASVERAQGNWYQYTADLSGVSGIDGDAFYFALRHFDCTDMFRLNVDDVVITGVELAGTTPVDPTEPPVEPTEPPVATDLDEALNVPGGTIHFENDATYPWTVEVDGDRAYGQSGNAGVGNSTSTITATVTVPAGGGIVTFDYKAWGEGSDSYNWDKCNFFVDGEQIFSYGNHQNDWETFEYALTEGTHELQWQYKKDGSVNPTGDYFAVDNVYVGEPVMPESIEVTDLEVGVGRHKTVQYTVLPANTTDKTVTFSVADTDIATVDENGVVTGVAEGTTTITVTAAADPSVSGTATITVFTPDPSQGATVILNIPNDVWGDGSGYQMLLDEDANTYGSVIPVSGGLTSSGDAPAGVYDEFEYKIPENADGSLNTQNILVQGQIEITIPAGTYDWCITNPTPGDRVWIASSNGNIPGRYDDFEFEAGVVYTFTVTFGGQNDQVDLTTDGEPTNPTQPPVVTNPPTPVEGIIWDFETDPETQGWQFVDQDGDGYNWEWLYGYSGQLNFHEGDGFICSESYVNYVGALEPDNWAYTPEFEVPANGQFAFWAQGQDASWCDEVLGVFVNGTQIGSDIVLTANDTQYTFDLSAYAGQTISVAIRHYNVTDMFRANVDYVTVSGDGEPTVTNPPVVTEPPVNTPVPGLNDLDEALNIPGGSIHFENDATYPWTVEVEGDRTFGKSGNAGNASTNSAISAVVTVPAGGGIVTFDFKAWGEGSYTFWDHCDFAVDGEVVMTYGAYQNDWETFEYALTEGSHTLTWSYTKDSSVNPTGDYFAVDNVYVGEPVMPTSIQVTDMEVGIGRHKTVQYTVLPANTTDKSVTFSVANTAIATVDANGVVTGVAEGTTTITVTSVADPTVSGTATITVFTPDPNAGATVILNIPNDVWGDGSGYQMLLDEDANTYGSVIPVSGGLTSSGDAPDSVYAEFEYTIPENADGHLNTQNILVQGQIEITIPEGTYDWCITNPTPGDRVWIASSNGNIPGRYDDFVFEAGLVYTFTVTFGGQNDQVDLTIDGEPGTPTPTPVAPTNPPTPVEGIIWDFETDPEAQGWQFVDQDGDGYNWEWLYGYAGQMNFHEGDGFICSESYVNYVGALYPDNWAYTPEFEVPANGEFAFWAQGQDASYAEEVLGVFVNGTQIGSDIVLTGSDTQYTFDLSAYAGQTIRVAIRHYNVTDMFRANVDYVTVTGEGEPGTPTPTPVAPTPTPVPTEPTGIIWDFETDPEAQGWQFVDQDGDGYNWEWLYGYGGQLNFHEGDGLICSESYVNYVGALTPDNWAYTPEFTVAANGQISFWAQGQDASWCDEVLGVFVNGTQIGSDITLTANDTQYTFDLSAYAGQTIRVAIRHYHVTDMFRANVDYVEVTGSGDQPPVTDVWGDVNSDGQLTAEDVLALMRYVQGITTGAGLNLDLADVNGDGVIDLVDVLLMLRKAMGIIPAFPVE